MKKLLIIGDSTCSALLSQIVPIAKHFSKEYFVDYYTPAPVNLQMAYHMPFINYVLCGKVFGGTNSLDYITTTEGFLHGVQRYFYDTEVDISEVKISPRFYEWLDQYEKILIIYDGEFYPIIWFIEEIYSKFSDRCIGRYRTWNKEMRPLNPNEYIPKETTEALGFQWAEDLLHLDYEWYKTYDNGKEYSPSTLLIQCSAGCESYMPYHDWQTFFPCGKLSNILKRCGFEIIMSNRREDSRKQLFHLKSKFVLYIDSITLWLARAFNNNNLFCFSTPSEINSVKLGIDSIIDPRYTCLHQLSADIVADSFLEAAKNRCPLPMGLFL